MVERMNKPSRAWLTCQPANCCGANTLRCRPSRNQLLFKYNMRLLVCIEIGTFLCTRPYVYFLSWTFTPENHSTNSRRVHKVCSPLESPVKAVSSHSNAFVLLLHIVLKSLTKFTPAIVQSTIWTTKKAARTTRVTGDKPRRKLV